MLHNLARRLLRRPYLRTALYLNGYFNYAGQRIFAPRGSIIFERITRNGTFEPEIGEAMVAFARPDTTILDVGSNIAVMTAAVLARRSAVRIIAIECSPSTLPYLRRTHEVSRYKERWQVIKVAISGKDQVLDFYTSGPELGPYDGLSDTGRGGAASKVAVIGKRLDTVWDGLGRPPVSLVKIDIEGGEWEAIKGAEALISACRPYIIFEWNVENLRAYNRSAEDIFAIAPERYYIYTLPNLAPLNPSVLSLELMRTEMFLLAPVLPLARSQTIHALPGSF